MPAANRWHPRGGVWATYVNRAQRRMRRDVDRALRDLRRQIEAADALDACDDLPALPRSTPSVEWDVW